jgi:hypothetical protein
MQVKLNYKDYSANFENNVLNIYANNRLLASRAYSEIIYNDEVKNIFENIVDANM